MFANARVATTLPIADLDRAIKFYANTLGLKPLEAPYPGFESEMALFEAGDCSQFLLYRQEAPANGHRDHTAASFQVEDLDAAIATLEERGVSMEQYDQPGLKTDERGIVTMGPMRGVWFKDPEGNILSVVE